MAGEPLDPRARKGNSRSDLLREPRQCGTPSFRRPGARVRMVSRAWKGAKHYYGRGDGHGERLDRDDRSVPLFKRAEDGVA